MLTKLQLMLHQSQGINILLILFNCFVKNILGQLEADKIFNGVVITEFTTKDNSTAGSSNTTQEISADTAVPNSNQHSNSLFVRLICVFL